MVELQEITTNAAEEFRKLVIGGTWLKKSMRYTVKNECKYKYQYIMRNGKKL